MDDHEEHILKDNNEENPLDMYGQGIESYFSFVNEMARSFCKWSILAIVVIFIFKCQGNLTGNGTGLFEGLAKISFGNFEGYT